MGVAVGRQLSPTGQSDKALALGMKLGLNGMYIALMRICMAPFTWNN